MEDNGNQEEMKVLTTNVCPVCGSTDFVLEKKAREEKESGRVSATYATPALIPNLVVPFVDPTKLLIGATVPGYVFVLDICDKCHTVIARQIIDAKVQIQGMQQGQPGMPPGAIRNTPKLPFKLPPNMPHDGMFGRG
jgi:hypothetical protein